MLEEFDWFLGKGMNYIQVTSTENLTIPLDYLCFVRGVHILFSRDSRGMSAKVKLYASFHGEYDAPNWTVLNQVNIDLENSLILNHSSDKVYTHVRLQENSNQPTLAPKGIVVFGKFGLPRPSRTLVQSIPNNRIDRAIASRASLKEKSSLVPLNLFPEHTFSQDFSTAVTLQLGGCALIDKILIDLTRKIEGELSYDLGAQVLVTSSNLFIPKDEEWSCFGYFLLRRDSLNTVRPTLALRGFRTTHVKVRLMIHGPIRNIIAYGRFVNGNENLASDGTLGTRGYPVPIS